MPKGSARLEPRAPSISTHHEAVLVAVLLTTAGSVGCAAQVPPPQPPLQPTLLEARSDADSRVLAAAGQVPADEAAVVGSLRVAKSYDAASGRRCRHVAEQAASSVASEVSLVCLSGARWFLVPPLTASPLGSES